MVDDQLTGVNAEIMRLRAELELDVDGTPQDDFDKFLEGSNQLTPRALRAAEQEYRQAEDDDEERDYLNFLKTSGQVPTEHPPEEDFEEFLETTNQLTPRALRAAEQEYKASEAAEEEEDFAQFLSETGQIRFPVPAGAGSIEDVLSSAEQDILRLRQELGTQCDASTARRTSHLTQFCAQAGSTAPPLPPPLRLWLTRLVFV